MNKRITVFLNFLLCLFLFAFAGCYFVHDGGDGPNQPEPARTNVRFVNGNAFPVTIYTDSARQFPFTEIPAGSQSDPITAVPNSDGAHYYPTYQIVMEDIKLPYHGEEVIARIDKDKTTTITIRLLKELGEASPNVQLTANTYIKIQNNGSFSLTLRKGSSELVLEGVDSTILNGGETGFYKIQPGTVSDYSLRKNTVDNVPFPPAITQFNAALIYTFNFNGSGLTLQSQLSLTLGEAGKITGGITGPNIGDGTESSPIQLSNNTWANGVISSDTRNVWYSFPVVSGTTYYVWWNDSGDGNKTKTADVNVSAYYSSSSPFFSKDEGYTYPASFKPNSNGTVKIKVSGYYYDDVGSFGIVYNTTGARPAVPITY